MARDQFAEARSIYNTRKRLLEKADKLLEEASPQVQALVGSIEEADAHQVIETLPSSPEASQDPGPGRLVFAGRQ